MTPEFQLRMYYSSSYYVARVAPMSPSNEVMTSSYVGVLNLNDTISSGKTFVNYGTALTIGDWKLDLFELNTNSSYSYGNWGGTNTDKYIGVKFDESGSTYYGWIRVDADLSTSTPSTWSITIKDYAYQSIADSSILAGDKGYTTNIEDAFNTVQAYSFNKNININFNKSDYANAQINVYNNLGQLVHSQEATNQKEVIDMSSHAMGVYYVKVQSDKGMISRKVFLK